MNNSSKTIAFFGASGGVGLTTLKLSLAAGHKCIALCREPSKLTAIFPNDKAPNLKIVKGNAHDLDAVSQCLQASEGKMVDMVISTIGGRPTTSYMGLVVTFEEPEVCQKGANTLLGALKQLRRKGVSGNPHIVACSATGHSQFGRDLPLLMVPIYACFKTPHIDKKVMEDMLIESGEAFTIIRASFFVGEASEHAIRVGIVDPKTGEGNGAVIGYTISREDVGRWIAENLVLKREEKYDNKFAVITY